MTKMDLTTVTSTQKQMQMVQIAADRAQMVLDQLGDDQYNLRNKLQFAVKTLKSAEADIASMLGFEWHAANLRGDDRIGDVMIKANALTVSQLNNYKSIGQK